MIASPSTQRVLVTGAGGFIGSHLVEHLARHGFRVCALVRYTSSSSRGLLSEMDPELRARVEIVRGDVRDAGQVDALCDGCELVFHLAALIGIPYSYEAPRSYTETNVGGTQNVLEAARRHGVRRVLITSTSEVYGTAEHTPISETHRLHPQSPYAASKVGADQLGLSYWRSFGVPVVVVRPFNTYGPRQSQRAVIPTIVAQALRRSDGRIELGAVSPRRDLLYVDDTVRGFQQLAEASAEAVVGETFNLATGTSVTIGELAQLVCDLLGRPSTEIVQAQHRMRPEASEVYVLEGDAARIHDRLGWQPLVSLRDGLSRVIDDMRRRLASRAANEPDAAYWT